MARQGNILSYDEMRRSGKARSGSRAPAPQSRSVSSGVKNQRSSRSSRRSNASRSYASSYEQAPSAQRQARKISQTKENNYFAEWGTAVKKTSREPAPYQNEREQFSANRTSGRLPRVQNTRSTSDLREETASPNNPRKENTGGLSKIAHIKKQLTKSKAGKEFTKQFGDTTSAAASGESRAAVYKAEMGKSHKRANAMQSSTTHTKGLFGWALPFSFSGLAQSPKRIASLMVAVCIVLSCAYLYPTAQHYYIGIREHDKLSAEYNALQQRNQGIQESVDSLSTEQGIEDRARSEFGWVKDGENAVNVAGLNKPAEDAVATVGVIVPGSIDAPETWYSPVFDVVFGYQ